MLFKELAGVDAFPLCLDTKDVDEIVRFVERRRADVRRHQPRGHRGAALLRDRAAAEGDARHPGLPRRPARHRGRRAGGAAERAAGRRQARARTSRVVMVGAGAAGLACAKIMLAHGVSDLVVCDIGGILHPGRPDLDGELAAMAARTNPRGARRGTADDALAGADVVIGVSAPGAVHRRRRSARWPTGRDRLRDGQPDARGPARGGLGATSRSWPPAARLPEPDQQRARLPGRLPRRARRARPRDRRGDEARRRPRDRRASSRRRSSARGLHHPERLQPPRRARRWPRRSRRPRSPAAWRGAAAARRTTVPPATTSAWTPQAPRRRLRA